MGQSYRYFILCQKSLGYYVKIMFMKIFCKFPSVNISKLTFWLVIHIANNLICTTLKAIFSVFRFFFATSDSQIVVISVKYCPVFINHTSVLIYSAFIWCIYLNKKTVVQGHIWNNCPFSWNGPVYWTFKQQKFACVLFSKNIVADIFMARRSGEILIACNVAKLIT